MLREIVQNVNEASGWQILKSEASGVNKGIDYLTWVDGEDTVQIARTAEDQYTIFKVSAGGAYTDYDYEFTLREVTSSGYYKSLTDDNADLPKIPKKLVQNLPILKDEGGGWGSKIQK